MKATRAAAAEAARARVCVCVCVSKSTHPASTTAARGINCYYLNTRSLTDTHRHIDTTNRETDRQTHGETYNTGDKHRDGHVIDVHSYR